MGWGGICNPGVFVANSHIGMGQGSKINCTIKGRTSKVNGWPQQMPVLWLLYLRKLAVMCWTLEGCPVIAYGGLAFGDLHVQACVTVLRVGGVSSLRWLRLGNEAAKVSLLSVVSRRTQKELGQDRQGARGCGSSRKAYHVGIHSETKEWEQFGTGVRQRVRLKIGEKKRKMRKNLVKQ